MKKLLYILLLLPGIASAQIKVAVPFVKNNPADNSSTGYTNYITGTDKIVQTYHGRDSLVTYFNTVLQPGTLCYEITPDSTYRWSGTAWVAYGHGAAGADTTTVLTKSLAHDTYIPYTGWVTDVTGGNHSFTLINSPNTTTLLPGLVSLNNSSSGAVTQIRPGFLQFSPSGSFYASIVPGNITANRTDTIQNRSGTVALNPIATGLSTDSVWVIRNGVSFKVAQSSITGTSANPTASIGVAAVNGSASTYMRSDAAPKIDSTAVATKAFVNNLAPKNSPIFTGTPTVPTAAPGTNTTQVASTAFVLASLPTFSRGLSSVSNVVKLDTAINLTWGKTGGVTKFISDTTNIVGVLGVKSTDGYKTTLTRASTTAGMVLANQTIPVSGPGNGLSFVAPQNFTFPDTGMPTNLATATFSISVWFRSTATINSNLIFNWGSSNVTSFFLYMSFNGQISMAVNGGNIGSSSSSGFNNGVWHHAVVTFGSGSQKLYVDNNLITTGSSSATFTLGGSVSNTMIAYNTNMQLDQLVTWNTTLTGGNVTTIYAGGTGTLSLPGSPVNRFELEDGIGASAVNTGSNGSSFNMTLNNTPIWLGPGNARVPTASGSVPIAQNVIQSNNGVNASETAQDVFGCISCGTILRGLNIGLQSSDGNYSIISNSMGNLFDPNNTSLTPTITALNRFGAGTASLPAVAFTSGTDLTTPIAGAWYYNGTRLGFSPSTTIKRVALTNDVTPTNGQIPIGNATDYTVANITAGNGIAITNGSGSITVAVSDITPTVSSAGTLALSAGGWFVFTGTTSTWTLPAVSNTGRTFHIKNRGSGNLTVQSFTAGNDIYTTSPQSSITVAAGGAIVLNCDGTYFNAQ